MMVRDCCTKNSFCSRNEGSDTIFSTIGRVDLNHAKPSFKRYDLLFLLLLFILMPTASLSSELTPRVGDYRFTYDNLQLPENESMGLLGGSYLLRKGPWYGGLGTYSAVTGKRGGFYTIGLEFGRLLPLSASWRLNLNGFVGGGGGGSAPQGGGLMLRESLAIEYLSGHNSYSLGVSAVQFPNGDISSEQVTFGFGRRFESLFAPVDYDLANLDHDILHWLNNGKNIGFDRYQFSAQWKQYRPSSDARMTTGQPHPDEMRLLGVKVRYFPVDSFYTGLATYGANGGGVDGFAQLGLIAGILWPLTPMINSHIEFQLGSAGGGRVESGGGLIVASEFGLNLSLSNAFLLGIEVGYITAPGGEFFATSYGLSAGYQYDLLTVLNSPEPLFSDSALMLHDWRVRLLHQRYNPANGGEFRKPSSGAADDLAVDLVGISMDLFITPKFYLSGQAIGAYDGGAGGYAVGMFALGYQQPVTDSLLLGGEVGAGSAGGGGLAVGDGLVRHYYLTAEYQLTKQISLEMAMGRFEAFDGSLQADLFQLSLAYRFSEIVSGR